MRPSLELMIDDTESLTTRDSAGSLQVSQVEFLLNTTVRGVRMQDQQLQPVISASSFKSANGTLIMLLFIFLSGIFLNICILSFVLLSDPHAFYEALMAIKDFFSNPFSLYIAIFFTSFSLGLASYLVSYLVIALPLSVLRITTESIAIFQPSYDIRKLTSFSRYKAHVKNEEDARFMAFFILTNRGRKNSSDIRFLFTQLLFARSALCSIVICTLFVPKMIELLQGDSQMFVPFYRFDDLFLPVVTWVAAVVLYGAGQRLVHRTIFLMWAASYDESIEQSE